MGSHSVIIVGAGCFGVSTAVHLLQENGSSGPIYAVTVIDASDTIPAPDAASTDLNKIVRSSYSDPFYTSLARAAMCKWTSLGDAYHESGVLVLGGTTPYGEAAMSNDIDYGADVLRENDPLVRNYSPADAGVLSNLDQAYLNRNGGWANATAAMTRMITLAKELGAQFLTGQTLVDLVFKTEPGRKQRVVGIKTANGNVLHADIVVLAMGAWTPSSLCSSPGLGIADKLVASGQCVAHIQLDEKLAAKYSATPVILKLGGFYMFPPTEDNIVKIAIHGEGYTWSADADSSSVPNVASNATSTNDKVSTLSPISTPRTVRTHGERGLDIPLEMAQLLRAELRRVYPELADLPFSGTRMCWYADTRDEDWIIDEHPNHPNLYFATGGSGHAFKFLPILGGLVVQRLKNTLPPDVAAKFSFSRPAAFGHGYRTGVVKALNDMVFATEADLSNTKVDPMPEVRV